MTRVFNETQEAFIRENVKGISNQDLTDLVNEECGLNVTRQQVITFKKNRKISSGLDGRFKPGDVPRNKGTKGLYNVGGSRTSFKKGQEAHNYKPIGHERLDRDGYVLVKVHDDGPWHKRWRHKHRVVWEAEYGPIPKDYCLIFLDQDKQNIVLGNLRMISRGALMRMNQNDLISDDPAITETGIIIAEIHTKIGKRNKK